MAPIPHNLEASQILRHDPAHCRGHGWNRLGDPHHQLLRIVTTTLHDWGAATETEKARAASFLLGHFKFFENAWFQMRKGTLERNQWQGYNAFLRTDLFPPAVKPWWQMRRTFFAPGFREYVDQRDVPPNVPSLTNIVQRAS
jgi:hypothetical protein